MNKLMRNEQKAIKIVEQYETRYNDTCDLLWSDLEDIAMQAMQWKEQQMIDKAVEWLKSNCTYNDSGVEKCIVNLGFFIDAMNGE